MTATPTRGRPTLVRWLIGVLLGVLVGLLVAVAPLLGLIIGALAAAWAIAGRPRVPAGSGLLIGTGAMYLALIARAMNDCTTIVVPNFYRDCRPPNDLGAYESAAVFALVVGVLLAVASLLMASRGRDTVDNTEDQG
jgi:hypothetical protein